MTDDHDPPTPELRVYLLVRDAARIGQRLVLGPRAVLTPLARDRARASGVEIDREDRKDGER